MNVSSINVARVTHNLRSFNLLNTLRGSQVEMFRTQNQLATGLRFIAPSDDPARAAASSQLDQRMDVLNQLEANLRQVNLALGEGESAMQDAIDQVIDAHTLASEAANDTLSAEERDGLRVVVESAIDSLIGIANRQYLDTYLFSGLNGNERPFEWVNEGVLFRGDNGRLQSVLDTDFSQDSFTISGQEFFNATSDSVQGYVDLNPQITLDTRLSDLRGATGTGIEASRLVITAGTEYEVDLTNADTIGDVIDQINATLPAGLTASLQSNSVRIQSSGAGTFTVTDEAGGTTAVELGIYTPTPTVTVFGDDLDVILTPRTTVADLNAGAGLALGGGITIRNGSLVAQVDFTNVTTVEDVLNRINQSNAGVLAKISDNGDSIDVVNRISGAPLSIEERGGLDATRLGIRSMHAETSLAGLNDGLGVDSVDGDDIRITTANGTTIDIDIDDVDLTNGTLQDVIDLINTAGGGAITAGLASTGNGLVIADNTAGGGTLQIERLHVSPAIDSLGLDVTATGNQLVGQDVNPIIVDSPFTALLELRDALAADDARAITSAGQRLSGNLDGMLRVQGRLAATAQSMLRRSDRVADEKTATQILQSDVRDVDITEALVRYQQVETALQANLTVSSRIMNLSLLDYLR